MAKSWVDWAIQLDVVDDRNGPLKRRMMCLSSDTTTERESHGALAPCSLAEGGLSSRLSATSVQGLYTLRAGLKLRGAKWGLDRDSPTNGMACQFNQLQSPPSPQHTHLNPPESPQTCCVEAPGLAGA